MSQPKSLAEQLEALVNGGSRPSWDEYFMATAVLVSSRSSCERLHSLGGSSFLAGAKKMAGAWYICARWRGIATSNSCGCLCVNWCKTMEDVRIACLCTMHCDSWIHRGGFFSSWMG
jgi:hypothetical protein